MDAPDRHRPALLASVLLVVAVAVVGLALVLTGGGAEPDPEPEPPAAVEPEPEPEPDPEPEPPSPVVGEYGLSGVVDVSIHRRRVYGLGMPQEAPVVHDAAAVDAFVDAMATWLDAHFTELQDGGLGRAQEAGLVGPPEVVSLTDPDHPVSRAEYAMVVFARAEPEWARVAVDITRSDGSVLRANFVFLPGDPPFLVAAEGQGTRPPSGESREEEAP
jgi:hypothetical protein